MANILYAQDIPLNRDILAHLLTFVSSRKDLLAVCLANKALLGLAEPQLAYRDIRCQLTSTAVWVHLSNPAYASRVRKLVIQRQYVYPNPYADGHSTRNDKERIPSGVQGQSGAYRLPAFDNLRVRERCERLLIQAVSNMVNLESFTWDRFAPVINRGRRVLSVEGEAARYTDDIWTILRDHTSMKILKVVHYTDPKVRIRTYSVFNSTLFTLKNLTELDLTMGYFEEKDEHEWDMRVGRFRAQRIQNLLDQCPNIEFLSLCIDDDRLIYDEEGDPFPPYLTGIFLTAHWPRLTSLKLQDVFLDDITTVNFLWRHSTTLKRLSASVGATNLEMYLPFNFWGHATAMQGILAKLEHVSLPPDLLRPLLEAMSPSVTLQSIDHLQPIDWDADEDGQLRYIESRGLRSLTLKAMDDVKQLDSLIPLTPDLEYLTIAESEYCITSLDDKRPHIEILCRLGQWKKLVSFKGLSMWTSQMTSPTSPGVSMVAAAAVGMCPNLREVPWTDHHTATFVKDRSGAFLRLELSE